VICYEVGADQVCDALHPVFSVTRRPRPVGFPAHLFFDFDGGASVRNRPSRSRRVDARRTTHSAPLFPRECLYATKCCPRERQRTLPSPCFFPPQCGPEHATMACDLQTKHHAPIVAVPPPLLFFLFETRSNALTRQDLGISQRECQSLAVLLPPGVDES